MPITVSCSCGRRLKAPDKLLGKKAKCPDCGKVLLIEAEQTPDPATAPATAKGPSQGGSSRVIDADDSDGAYGLAGDDDDMMPSDPPAPAPSTTQDQGPNLSDLAMLQGGTPTTPGSELDPSGDNYGLIEKQEEEGKEEEEKEKWLK